MLVSIDHRIPIGWLAWKDKNKIPIVTPMDNGGEVTLYHVLDNSFILPIAGPLKTMKAQQECARNIISKEPCFTGDMVVVLATQKSMLCYIDKMLEILS